jgi:hypothetical protein
MSFLFVAHHSLPIFVPLSVFGNNIKGLSVNEQHVSLNPVILIF